MRMAFGSDVNGAICIVSGRHICSSMHVGTFGLGIGNVGWALVGNINMKV